MAKRKSGEGMIRLRSDGRWEGRYVVGYDEKGLPKTKNVLAKTKRECQEKLKEKLGEQTRTPETKARPSMPFGEWIDLWYRSFCEPKLRATTAAAYENHIYKHIIPGLGDIALNKLSQGDLQAFYAQLKKSGRLVKIKQFGEGLSDRAVRACHGCIFSALESALRQKLIYRNPAVGCRLPPKKGREMQILTREETQRLLFEAKEEGFYELFLLDLATGLRRGELLALRWEDLDFERGELHIRRQVERVNGRIVERDLKTKNAARTLILPPELIAVLRRYRETVNSRWMFPSPVKEDQPRDQAACRKRLSQILERAGCKHVRFHDLRHAFATNALQYGMDVKTLAAVIGHASVETTLNIYAHVTSEMKTQAAKKIDRFIRAESGEEEAETALEKKEKRAEVKFVPYKGKIRRRGTGCVSKIGEHLWEGRCSPRLPNGKRDLRLVYAHSEEECEEKLAEAIRRAKEERAS